MRLQADEPYPNENVVPPPDEESDVESRINSDNEDRDSDREDHGHSSEDDGEDLMDNLSGYSSGHMLCRAGPSRSKLWDILLELLTTN